MSFWKPILLALLAAVLLFGLMTYYGRYMPRSVYHFDQGSISIYKTKGTNQVLPMIIFNGLRRDPPVQEELRIPPFVNPNRWKPSKRAVEKLLRVKYADKLIDTHSLYTVSEVADLFVSHEEYLRAPPKTRSIHGWSLESPAAPANQSEVVATPGGRK
ncbi:MAG TPA: hypothetical protein VJW76_01140 [Verrucomicrobiae bacterium]|nr:hypothetical protein [Verrucomicrobiae bacterium]